MKIKALISGLLTVAGLTAGLKANAQFGSLFQKAKDKAAQKASEAFDKKTSSTNTSSSNAGANKGSKIIISSGFDFVPGDTVLFAEDFASVPVGASTKTFKTNGSATIVSVNTESGKWLTLADQATYKLSKQLFYPKHFTVEFDILTAADKISDIYPVNFGFVTDNSVRDYTSSSGAYVALKYYNNDDVSVNSEFVSKYLNSNFDLTTFTNRKMHVSIVVDGERMVVYLDQTKLADTIAFLPTTAKNLYISGPMQYQNGAKAMVSNFVIKGFKKA
ncbi:hypothetical protein LX99_04008 [Mucilaginibacter oryzae]|uniref:Concanavalin A-like lectin/glucanase superfamily protein n=1 Tax=Mucilaginibacter oryzae TaxID=468058 RepID=A0A316H2V1_9SPHI|nr:hypothetical protein [Mucilaginibacter oryzae]PWK74207.1 hypothetical protein LX99_04008 [Mucilaginibacter oryzae]